MIGGGRPAFPDLGESGGESIERGTPGCVYDAQRDTLVAAAVDQVITRPRSEAAKTGFFF